MNASDDFQFRRLSISHIVVQITEVTELEKWSASYNGCNYEASSMVLRARYFPPVFQMAFKCSYGIHSVTKRILEKFSQDIGAKVLPVCICQEVMVVTPRLGHWGNRLRVTQYINLGVLIGTRGASENMNCRADSRFAPSQWETSLLCNDVSHWLGASLESVLKWKRFPYYWTLCAGDPSDISSISLMGSPHKRPAMRSFDFFCLQIVEQAVDLLVIWDVMTPIWPP